MPVLVLRLSNIQSSLNMRPSQCPKCGGQILQRWGSSSKVILDTDYKVAAVYRYKCSTCNHTFREYPQGIDKTGLSQRVRNLAALAWALGLSTRKVVTVFRGFGIEINYMTVWRDGKELANLFSDRFGKDRLQRYRIDELFLKNSGRGIGTTIILDFGDRRSTILGKIDEYNPRIVKDWLEPYVQGLDIEISLFNSGELPHFQPLKKIVNEQREIPQGPQHVSPTSIVTKTDSPTDD